MSQDKLISGKATNSAYQSLWQWWNRWCAGRWIDFFLCHVGEFLDFLAVLRRGLRAHDGQFYTVRRGSNWSAPRLIRGIQLKIFKTATWDVDSVTQYLDPWRDIMFQALQALAKLGIIVLYYCIWRNTSVLWTSITMSSYHIWCEDRPKDKKVSQLCPGVTLEPYKVSSQSQRTRLP